MLQWALFISIEKNRLNNKRHNCVIASPDLLVEAWQSPSFFLHCGGLLRRSSSQWQSCRITTFKL